MRRNHVKKRNNKKLNSKKISYSILCLEIIIGLLTILKLFLVSVNQTDINFALTSASKNILLALDQIHGIHNNPSSFSQSLTNVEKFTRLAVKDLKPYLGTRVHGCGYKNGLPSNSVDAKDGIVAITNSPAGELLGFTDLVEITYPDGTPCKGMVDDPGLLQKFNSEITHSNWIEVFIAILGGVLIFLKIKELRSAN